MADSSTSPKLKRKREGADSQRKKQRKGKGPAEGADVQMEDTTPATTPIASTKAKKGQDQVREEGLTNGVHEQTATPTSNKKDKKKPQSAPANSLADGIPEPSPSSKGRKKKGRHGQNEKDEEQTGVNGEDLEHVRDISQAEPTAQAEMPLKHQLAPSRLDKKQATDTANSQAVIKPDAHDAHDVVIEKKTANKKAKKQNAKKHVKWSVSPPTGGWFLPQDPIFTLDEKYMILATPSDLQLFSTETSLLTSSLSGQVSAYAMSSVNPHRVYTANEAGLITLWDWAEDKKIGRWDIGSNVRHVAVTRQPDADQDLVYCHEMGSSHIINVHALRTKGQAAKTELKQILKTKSSISGLQVLLDGKIVVATTAKSVLIGKRSKLHKTAVQDFEYKWREFKTSKAVTTFDTYVRLPERVSKEKQPGQDVRDNLDLAIGDETGVIYVLEDILSFFAQAEKSSKTGTATDVNFETFRPKRLHWHREAVGSVKWSRDGNYLISGGDETVIKIWQLSTGKQENLPHLTAAIENIVISPSGASYAVSLANNSMVVLSTTELQAKTNIIGIQSRRVDMEQRPRNSPTEYSFDIFSRVPMAVDPKNTHHLLFSTPSSQPRNRRLRVAPEPYLQTFDIATQRPIARQALARNNATDLNVTPDGGKIFEPTVKFLQTSKDGKWLATVDEWMPPHADMSYLDDGVLESKEDERSFRRDIYLKFWRWDEKTLQWILDSRIDTPHFFEDVGASARVLDLISDPSHLGFATVGDDRFVRIWRPKTRLRDGTIVRGANQNTGTALITWSLERTIELSSGLDAPEPTPSAQASLTPMSSRLAFSADGSVIAAGVSWDSEADPGVIHIIDALAGTVRRSITEVDVTALSCLGILDRHMIVVGDSIIVWDLVVDELVYCVPLLTAGIDRFDRTSLVQLAINVNDKTFAVSAPQFTIDDRPGRRFQRALSKVSIFDTNRPQTLWSSTLPAIILSLASAADSKGYIALNSLSCVQSISPMTGRMQLIAPPAEPAPEAIHQRQEESEIEEEQLSETLTGSENLFEASENDKPVVRPEELQQILDIGPSHALPPVKDMLNAVVGLYARKPRVVGAA